MGGLRSEKSGRLFFLVDDGGSKRWLFIENGHASSGMACRTDINRYWVGVVYDDSNLRELIDRTVV